MIVIKIIGFVLAAAAVSATMYGLYIDEYKAQKGEKYQLVGLLLSVLTYIVFFVNYIVCCAT